MKKYVLGFAFSSNAGEETVLLIRKNKPAWQAGLLNGIGGSIEPTDATPADAMTREFQEECGITTHWYHWSHYLTLRGKDFEVYVFAASGVDISKAVTTTAELVLEASTKRGLHTGCVHNLPWLIEMSRDPETRTWPLLVEYKSAAARPYVEVA